MIIKLITTFLKNPSAFYNYLSKGGNYRYALKQFLKFNITNAAELSKQIIEQKNKVISFHYKGEEILMKNEDGGIYYITQGVEKLEAVVNKLSLPKNATVVDAGGNVGLFSYFLKKRFPDSKILIVEPGIELLPIIRKNLSKWESDITIIPKALANKNGTITFYISENSAQLNSIFYEAVAPIVKDKAHIRKETVPCITLSDLLKENNIKKLDLLKIDIQGGEYPVLKNNPSEMQKINSLLAEVSFLTEDNVQLCALLSEYFPKSKVLGEVKMGADILFSK
jgi:FkbM family methyltransferase